MSMTLSGVRFVIAFTAKLVRFAMIYLIHLACSGSCCDLLFQIAFAVLLRVFFFVCLFVCIFHFNAYHHLFRFVDLLKSSCALFLQVARIM